jgi:hypothetical protein
LVGEINNQLLVALPGIEGSYIFDPVFLPQTVRFAEGTQTTLGTYSCTGKDYYLFHLLYYVLLYG